ncbi:hypothetical protein ACFLU3_04770 [Chloroflexota bacterium]
MGDLAEILGELTAILVEMERGLDQVQFMLTVITGFIGVIVTTIFIVGIFFVMQSRHSKQKALTSLQSEIKLNLNIVSEIFEASDGDSKVQYDTIPMSETAWMANIGGQNLTHLDKGMIEPLTQTYAKVHRANVYAARIEEREYNPEHAARYNTYLKAAQDDLTKTLKILGQY